ncbi:hypothetical protein PIB30_027618 [Stylosanthes scabra]|uniref:DUF4283 domain-containing protein n=1 Tax=Stylosanthes scabra TaxID=79078 RepID=A0ABU6Z8F6_9FABA|nr:hypothetical protein [Stylosanthes scabra]
MFQHADISIMSDSVQVFLYNLGGGFREIRKVGYRFLSLQPNGRFVHILVWLFNDEHVRVTFGCHRRLMPQHVMDFFVEVGEAGSPYGPPVAATPVCIAESSEGGECIPDTPANGGPRYILPAPPPIPRLADVPCFFQQLDLDEGASVDPLKAGMLMPEILVEFRTSTGKCIGSYQVAKSLTWSKRDLLVSRKLGLPCGALVGVKFGSSLELGPNLTLVPLG